MIRFFIVGTSFNVLPVWKDEAGGCTCNINKPECWNNGV